MSLECSRSWATSGDGLKRPMTCWSCQAENDLDATQTCLRCGAPLVKSWSVFRKSALAAVLLAMVAIQLVCVFGRVHSR